MFVHTIFHCSFFKLLLHLILTPLVFTEFLFNIVFSTSNDRVNLYPVPLQKIEKANLNLENLTCVLILFGSTFADHVLTIDL